MARKRCKRFPSFRPVFLPLLVNPPLSLFPSFPFFWGGVWGACGPRSSHLFLGAPINIRGSKALNTAKATPEQLHRLAPLLGFDRLHFLRFLRGGCRLGAFQPGLVDFRARACVGVLRGDPHHGKLTGQETARVRLVGAVSLGPFEPREPACEHRRRTGCRQDVDKGVKEVHRRREGSQLRSISDVEDGKPWCAR